MNTVNTTHVAPQAENGQSAAIEHLEALQQPMRRVLTVARVRYALLVSIAMLLTTLTFAALDSIRETEAEIDLIQATLASLPL